MIHELSDKTETKWSYFRKGGYLIINNESDAFSRGGLFDLTIENYGFLFCRFRKKKRVQLQVAPPGANRSGSTSPPEATGTPNGLENGMNGSRDSPDDIVIVKQGISTHSCDFLVKIP